MIHKRPVLITDRITFTTFMIEMPRSNTAEILCTSLLLLSPRATTGELAPALVLPTGDPTLEMHPKLAAPLG